MGLRPADLHVPSGPTSTPAAPVSSSATLDELITRKDALEAELSALSAVLDSHHVDMHTPLLTADGFPRADLDVAQIRATRSRIVHLRNDHKWLMEKVEKKVHEHFAATSSTSPNGDATSSTSTNSDAASSATNSGVPGSGNGATEAQTTIGGALAAANTAEPPTTPSELPGGALQTALLPFARVNGVMPNSPAEEAGLLVGDELKRYGSVDWLNHEKLSRVALVTQGSEGGVIEVLVLRAAGARREERSLSLRPRRGWGGRGLLGCHLVPL